MPKQVPAEIQAKWIELSDQGLSPWEIKKKLGTTTDTRTIEKAISSEAIRRATDEVRKRALIEALATHWRLLSESAYELETLAGAGSRVSFRKRPVYAIDDRNLAGNGWQARKKKTAAGGTEWVVELDYDQAVEAELLREHAGQDSFQSALTKYRIALSTFLSARLELAGNVVSAVEEVVRDEESDMKVELAGLAVLDNALFTTATSGEDLLGRLRGELVYEDDGKILRVSGALLASGDPSLPSETAARMIDSIEQLRGNEAWKHIAAAEAGLGRAAGELAREIARMKTMPSLPGACSACRRMG